MLGECEVTALVSADGLERVRVAVDDSCDIDPLRDWDHGCGVATLRAAWDVCDDYYTVATDDRMWELWLRVSERVEVDPVDHVPDSAERVMVVPDGFYGAGAEVWQEERAGGLIVDDRDAAEVFVRCARVFYGVEVVWRTLSGSCQSHWVEVVAWHDGGEADGGESAVSGFLDVVEAVMSGEVYGVIHECRHDWMDEDGEVMSTWDEIDSCWGFVGLEQAEAEARERLAACGARVA